MRSTLNLFFSLSLLSVSTISVNQFKEFKSTHCHIFRPDHQPNVVSLLAHPKAWVQMLKKRFEMLDVIVKPLDSRNKNERAISAYLDMILVYVTGVGFGDSEMSVKPALHTPMLSMMPLDVARRAKGEDWAYLGVTMVGKSRAKNLIHLLTDVFNKNVVGGFMETGVWRGGASILARATIAVHGQSHRTSFVCDSFSGLPPGNKIFNSHETGWDHTGYLEVSAESVIEHMKQANVLDQNVIFAKGFFNNTMPHLREYVDALAVLRLDGDIYESTIDVLYHMYSKVSVNGYVIVDDWTGFPAKVAVLDFLHVHGITEEMIMIDAFSAYWQKTQQFDVQYWRYNSRVSNVSALSTP